MLQATSCPCFTKFWHVQAWQGQRQPVVCAALFLGDYLIKMTRKPKRVESHILFCKTDDEGRKYFFCNIINITEKAWLVTRACVVSRAPRGNQEFRSTGAEQLDLQDNLWSLQHSQLSSVAFANEQQSKHFAGF